MTLIGIFQIQIAPSKSEMPFADNGRPVTWRCEACRGAWVFLDR